MCCDLECSCVSSWAWFDCYLPWGAFAELDVLVLLTGVNALLFVHWTLVSRWFAPLFSLGHWRSRGLPSCGSPSSCSSTCSRGFLFVRFPLGSCRLLARWVCPLSSPPVEGFVFVLCWFPFLVPAFVELVLLMAGASVAPGSGCLVLPGLRRFSSQFWYLGRFCGSFPSCGVPARWRDLRHVVLDICRK